MVNSKQKVSILELGMCLVFFLLVCLLTTKSLLALGARMRAWCVIAVFALLTVVHLDGGQAVGELMTVCRSVLVATSHTWCSSNISTFQVSYKVIRTIQLYKNLYECLLECQ